MAASIHTHPYIHILSRTHILSQTLTFTSQQRKSIARATNKSLCVFFCPLLSLLCSFFCFCCFSFVTFCALCHSAGLYVCVCVCDAHSLLLAAFTIRWNDCSVCVCVFGILTQRIYRISFVMKERREMDIHRFSIHAHRHTAHTQPKRESTCTRLWR